MNKPFSAFIPNVALRLNDPEARIAEIATKLDDARARKADLVVLPSLVGLDAADAERIVAASRDILVFFGDGERCFAAENGAPLFGDDRDGRRTQRSALPCSKAMPLENAREGAAQSAPQNCGVFATARLGCVAAVLGSAFGDGAPCEIPAGVACAVVCDCTPFARGRIAARAGALSAIARASRSPVVYANASGVRDIGKVAYAFDGAAVAVGADGQRLAARAPFTRDDALAEFGADGMLPGATFDAPADGIAEVVAALRGGISDLLAALRIKRVVIGVSGGIDSAVSTALYGSILPPEDILLVGMPGPFTSGTTRGLGRTLAANIGARFAEMPIGAAVDLTRGEFAALVSAGPEGGKAGAWTLSPFAVENVQARDRGSRVLAAAAAAFGGVVSCNANKSEITVGYGTLYGDILGWLACLGDLWKGDVYAVGRELNKSYYNRELIPEGIFTVKPSAELSEKQAVEKGLGDPLVYPYHDKLFRSWVESGDTIADSLAAYLGGTLAGRIGYEGDVGALFATREAFVADLERWWKLHRGLSVAKRMQAPPVFAVTRRPYGSFVESQLTPVFPRGY